MDYTFLFLTILITILITKLFLWLYRSNKNLPPSPRVCFPIIGHLHLLKQPLLHRTLLHLSHSLGPVFSLRLGSRLAVVVSSPAAAEECFLTKNDIVLANRPRFTMGKYVAYDYTSMVTAPYGDHWRNLRRITALEVFSTHRLNGSAEIRHDEVKRLLQKLHGLSVQRPAKVGPNISPWWIKLIDNHIDWFANICIILSTYIIQKTNKIYFIKILAYLYYYTIIYEVI